jgi:hypothetical protein
MTGTFLIRKIICWNGIEIFTVILFSSAFEYALQIIKSNVSYCPKVLKLEWKLSNEISKRQGIETGTGQGDSSLCTNFQASFDVLIFISFITCIMMMCPHPPSLWYLIEGILLIMKCIFLALHKLVCAHGWFVCLQICIRTLSMYQ